MPCYKLKVVVNFKKKIPLASKADCKLLTIPFFSQIAGLRVTRILSMGAFDSFAKLTPLST